MSLTLFRFLPAHGDGHYLGTAEGARELPQGANYVSPFGAMVANDILPKAASRS